MLRLQIANNRGWGLSQTVQLSGAIVTHKVVQISGCCLDVDWKVEDEYNKVIFGGQVHLMGTKMNVDIISGDSNLMHLKICFLCISISYYELYT